MADGAWEITKAVNEVFGNNTVKRLMCKSHMFTAYKTKLKKLGRLTVNLQNKLNRISLIYNGWSLGQLNFVMCLNCWKRSFYLEIT